MFDKVQNEGGRAACQNDARTFAIMRYSQFAPLPQTGRREALERRAAEEGAQPLLDELRAVRVTDLCRDGVFGELE